MTCAETARRLPGYLDGGTLAEEHALVREHLESCDSCREQLELYRRLASYMARIEPSDPPADLVSRILVEASHPRTPLAIAQRLWNRAVLVFRNILEPVAVPATGGLLAAVAAFALVLQSVLVSLPAPGSRDLPLGLVQPASVESLASFPISGIASDGQPLSLEATVDADGEVVSYKILSGPKTPDVQRQIYQLLLFSRFHPQTTLGAPTDGGHVIVRFSSLRVRG